jgi:ADP-ribosylglycohydrolase
MMLQQNGTTAEILEKAHAIAKKELKEPDSRYGYAELDKHLNVTKLTELELDKQSSIGYTYKCLGSAVWALKYGENFKDAICRIVREAGDADTNAAVAGALLGAKCGYDGLPQDWLEGLRHKKWLDEKVDRLLSLLDLSE